MTEADIEIILERAKERYPGVKPRIISDNVLTTECYKEVRAKISRPSEQRDRLHHAEGHAHRPSAGDSDRAGSEVGGGESAITTNDASSD